MSGNETSLNDDSSRLRDRASSAFQQARETAQRADRLRDRATTAFQQRRQQAARAEERLNTASEDGIEDDSEAIVDN